MGSFTSKEFNDLMEEDAPHTPVTGKKVLQLDFDPRSPTTGITRTPIQIEKTPDRLVDPRSPTVGIYRTPILNETTGNQGLSPNRLGLRRSHSFSEISPEKFDPMSMQDALASLPPLDLDSELEETQDGVKLIKRSNSEPELAIMGDSVSANMLCKEKFKVTKTTVRARKPKTALFQGNTNIAEFPLDAARSPLRILSDAHQRSPLGKRNVDVNSPRSIVQRKQTNKLGKLKSTKGNTPAKSATSSPCRFEAVSAEDKENLSQHTK